MSFMRVYALSFSLLISLGLLVIVVFEEPAIRHERDALLSLLESATKAVPAMENSISGPKNTEPPSERGASQSTGFPNFLASKTADAVDVDINMNSLVQQAIAEKKTELARQQVAQPAIAEKKSEHAREQIAQPVIVEKKTEPAREQIEKPVAPAVQDVSHDIQESAPQAPSQSSSPSPSSSKSRTPSRSKSSSSTPKESASSSTSAQPTISTVIEQKHPEPEQIREVPEDRVKGETIDMNVKPKMEETKQQEPSPSSKPVDKQPKKKPAAGGIQDILNDLQFLAKGDDGATSKNEKVIDTANLPPDGFHNLTVPWTQRCKSKFFPYNVHYRFSRELQDAVQTFIDRQQAHLMGTAREGQTYLVYRSRKKSGFGNRLLGLEGAFLLAMLTERVLLIDINENIANLFCAPLSEWTLDKMSADPIFKSTLEAEDVTLNELEISQKKLSTTLVQRASGLFQFEHTIEVLKCSDIKSSLRNRKVLYYISNMHIIPFLVQNPFYMGRLQKWFPNYDFFGPISRFLINPVDSVWDTIEEEYFKHMHNFDTYSAQVRVFKEEAFDETNRKFFECLETEHPNVRSSNQTKVFVASMSREVREAYVERYGQRAFWVELEELEAECLGCGSAKRWTADIVDNWLVSMADDVLIAPASTFGYVAYGRVSKEPLMVIPDLELHFIGGEKVYKPNKREDGNCHRLTKNLCYHNAWKGLEELCPINRGLMRNRLPPPFHTLEQCIDWPEGLKIQPVIQKHTLPMGKSIQTECEKMYQRTFKDADLQNLGADKREAVEAYISNYLLLSGVVPDLMTGQPLQAMPFQK